jgi:hypothetical protein
MAMGWLKGLVAPTAFSDGQGGQQQQQGMPGMQPGGPPVGGMPGQSPYGAAPGQMPPPGTPPIGAPGGPAPYDASALPNAMQWSTGTRTQGAAQGISGGGISGGGVSGGGISGGAGVSGGGAQSLEARVNQLQHDVESLALFARTLLTMLEEGKHVTREQFDATKHRLDMLDGKLDDR